MGFFSEEQRTSITLYIEKLSNLEDMDWYLVEQLTESIQMQEYGPREAVEALRKRLKHGGIEQKLRVIEILKVLMENSNQKFHRQFGSNEKMRERLEYIITSPTENIKVRKALVGLLGAWHEKYHTEVYMKPVLDLYDISKGKRKMSTPPPPPPTITPTNNNNNNNNNTINNSSGSINRRTFDFNKSKPKIIEEIAIANQNTNNLVNALKLINTNEDRWEIELQRNKNIAEYQSRCEESRKKIVRYARLVENEEWIGTLLATNEELLKALDLYDIMLTGEIPSQWKPISDEWKPIMDERKPMLIESKAEEEDPFADPFADPITPVEERTNYF